MATKFVAFFGNDDTFWKKKEKKNGIRSNIARYNISSVKLVFASQIVESHFSKKEVCRVTHKYTCFIDYNGYLRAEKQI